MNKALELTAVLVTGFSIGLVVGTQGTRSRAPKLDKGWNDVADIDNAVVKLSSAEWRRIEKTCEFVTGRGGAAYYSNTYKCPDGLFTQETFININGSVATEAVRFLKSKSK